MGKSKSWTQKEDRALLQGVGIYGIGWLQSRTGDSYDWPNAPKGRSVASLYKRARSLYGAGGLTRGSYSLTKVCTLSGYDRTQIRRAMTALGQKWKRTSRTGNYLIYEEQLEEIIQWLKNDYWSKKHRLYNCLRCGLDIRKHFSYGLCTRCSPVYTKRLTRFGLPVAIFKLLELVREYGVRGWKFAEEAEKQLNRGRALPCDILIQLVREWRNDN